MTGGNQGRRRIHVEGQREWAAAQPQNPFAREPQPPAPAGYAPTPNRPSFTADEAARQLAEGTADVERRLSSIKGRLQAIARIASVSVEAGRLRDAAAVAAAKSAALEARVAAERAAHAGFAQQQDGLLTRAQAESTRLAPAWAAAELGAAWTPPAESVPGECVRLGSVVPFPGFDPLPVLVPVINHPGVAVSGDPGEASEVVHAAALRLLAQSPLKHLALEVFDPRLRGTFGDLTGLRASHAGTFPQPAVDARSFDDRLERVLQSAVRNVELIRGAGVATLTDLWRLRGVPEGVLSVVVVLDYPYGIDRALQDRLLRIASIGGPSGTALLLAHDPGGRAASEVRVADLLDRLTVVRRRGDVVSVPGYPADGRADPPVPPAFVQSLVHGLATSAQRLQGPTIPLVTLLEDDLRQPWSHTSQESLDTVIGLVGRDPLQLSLRTENPPHPNLLVGGAVGQGKSNLVLDLVYGLAARYSPAELELVLLDFKRGLEFKRFAPDAQGRNWLPHVRVLSLESDQEFGVAVLAFADEEMERRSHLFKAAGANSLNAYRQATGEVLPRLMLVIDEFHVLFEGDDRHVEKAVEYLDRLAKQGRAYGLHLVLASQTTSGVRGLAIKGDSIFAQFPLRLSLKNTPAESQAILSEGNKAAAELTYRGEVVLNRNFGTDPEGSNIRGMAAFADPDDLSGLQARLWGLGHDDPPMVFIGREHAAWQPGSEPLPTSPDGGLAVLLGRPLSVTRTPTTLLLEQDADQAVAVLGPDSALAGAALHSVLRSAVPALARSGGSLVVLDASDPGAAAWLEPALADAAAAGVATQRIGRDDVARFLREAVPPRMRVGGPPVLVVGVALQRARGMDVVPDHEATDGGFGASFGFSPGTSEASGRGVLRRLVREGALAGVHVVGWWANVRTLEADLGPAHEGVSRYVTAGLGRDDLKSVAGVHAEPVQGWPRLGLFDRNSEGGLVTVVPFDPSTFKAERAHDLT